ncbi:MAG: hypothetical protein QM731_26005 [Chitinophagaceae bacterium]
MKSIKFLKHVVHLSDFIMKELLKRIEQKKNEIHGSEASLLEGMYGKVIIRLTENRFTDFVAQANSEAEVEKFVLRQIKEVWNEHYESPETKVSLKDEHDINDADGKQPDPAFLSAIDILWRSLICPLSRDEEQLVIRYILRNSSFKGIIGKTDPEPDDCA